MSGTEPRTISWHALQSADVAARLDVVPGKGLDEPEVASSSGLYPGNEGRQGDGSSYQHGHNRSNGAQVGL